MTGQEYQTTLAALTISLGALLLFWQHRLKLVPWKIPGDNKARHRPRPRPFSESEPQPERLPEAPRLDEVSQAESRPPVPLPVEETPDS